MAMSRLEMMQHMWALTAIKTGWFRFDSVEVVLPSGRKFQYQMRDYPFRVFSTDAEIDALCCKIIADKYRYCTWDRNHPKTNAEVEIFDFLKSWMLNEVAKAHSL